MNNKNGFFKTKDFYLACFLKTKGIKLSKVLREGSILIFCFEQIEDIKDIITGFYSDGEKVSAISFINTIRDLKALIHNT